MTHSDEQKNALNTFLVDVFNEILKSEEKAIGKIGNPSLSIKEMHVVEAVCNCKDSDNRSATISTLLNVTAGTLTTSVALLEKKGYIFRVKDERDRRVVHILPTQKGMDANTVHQRFHKKMVEHVLDALEDEEKDIFISGLRHISQFFNLKYENKTKGESHD